MLTLLLFFFDSGYKFLSGVLLTTMQKKMDCIENGLSLKCKILNSREVFYWEDQINTCT